MPEVNDKELWGSDVKSNCIINYERANDDTVRWSTHSLCCTKVAKCYDHDVVT